jgi:hypothetical protein
LEEQQQRAIDAERADDMLQAAKDHIRSSIAGDAPERDGDDRWVEIMQRIGLTSDYQERIMDPEFRAMREMGTAKSWALNMVDERYSFLLSLESLITRYRYGDKERQQLVVSVSNASERSGSEGAME